MEWCIHYGRWLGPWGVGFGALVGALIGSEMAKKATRKLFVQFFGTSRERALRNALLYLEFV